MKIDKWQGDDYPDCIEVSVQPISFFNNGSGGMNVCFSRFADMGYWADSLDLEHEPDGFNYFED